MANRHPFAFLSDENVRVGFGMDPDDKLNKANCLQPAKGIYKAEITNYSYQPHCVVFRIPDLSASSIYLLTIT